MGIKTSKRWEVGSYFHWKHEVWKDELNSSQPWSPGVMYGTGRDALLALLQHLTPNVERVWMPSYYCAEVVKAIRDAGYVVERYIDSPLMSIPAFSDVNLGERDILVIVNYFGLRSSPSCCFYERHRQGILIEDHTHDPLSIWANSSKADYCFASLRKWLPIPDGAVLWSPQLHELPRRMRVTRRRQEIVNCILLGMMLKASYLHGSRIRKSEYRRRLQTAERQLAHSELSSISRWSRDVLNQLPVSKWRRMRHRNYVVLARILQQEPRLRVLEPERSDCVPFAVVIVFQTRQQRDEVRQELQRRKIYAAVHWPVKFDAGIDDASLDLAGRILSIPCDMRYTETDMQIVGISLLQTFASVMECFL